MKRSQSINVAQNITRKYFVSTAMWATGMWLPTGTYRPTYETFIWKWNYESKERGKMLKEYYHRSRKEAINFHFRLCRMLAWREFKEVMPDDSPYENFEPQEEINECDY